MTKKPPLGGSGQEAKSDLNLPATNRQRLLELPLLRPHLIPVGPDKRPIGSGWNQPERQYSEEELTHSPAIGLRLGYPVLAVDFDPKPDDIAQAERTFQQLTGHGSHELPRSWTVTSGKPGRRQVLLLVDPVKAPWLQPRPGGGLEIRWRGQQSVIDGHHPETGGYAWLPGMAPWECELAEAPVWLLDGLNQAKPSKRKQRLIATPTELPPRSEAELIAALGRVPEFFHDQGRRPELVDLAFRLWVEVGATRAQQLLAEHSPSLTDLHSYFTGNPPNRISPGSIWPFLNEHYGVDLKRHDLKRSAAPVAPAPAPKPTPKRESKPRKLGHTRAMACFDRCVEVLAKRERNSLRRRARLLMIAKALGLAPCVNRQEIAQRVLEAKDQHQGNSYIALTAADRLSMNWPDVDWLVPDLLPANDLAIIGGRPKVGKTAFAMAIAAAVLKGQPVAGCEAPQAPRPVILVSDDQGDADTVRAMRQLGINDHQALLWSRRFRLTEQDLDKLLADVANHPGAVVIIDSLRSVSRALPHGENDPEIGAVIYDLKAAVTDAGGSLLLVHHCNKSAGLTGVEALSGHNAIAGAANTVLTLHYVEDANGKPCKEADQRRLVREGRTGKPLDWVISRTSGTPSFHKVGTYTDWLAQVEEASKQAKRESRQTTTQGEVLEVLAAASGRWLTSREVVEAMGLKWEGRGNGKDPSRVREALYRLAEEGEIRRVRAGTGFTFAAASHGAQIVSDTSITSAALQEKESERRGSPRHTSAPLTRQSSADSCRDSPRRRDRQCGKAADLPEVAEQHGASYQAVAIPGLELVELRRPPATTVGSAWDAEPA